MGGHRLLTEWDKLGREELRALQAQRLGKYLRDHVVPFSKYYRELFEKHNLDPSSFRSLDDLKRIPFVSKIDLISTPEHPDRARDFVLIPDEKILSKRPSVILNAILKGKKAAKRALEHEYRPIFLTSTTGRSAEPVPFLFSAHDLNNMTLGGDRLVAVLGSAPGDRLINMFPYAPHLGFWQTHHAVVAHGVFCISTGGGKVMGTDGNIRTIEKTNPSAIISMPTFAYHVLTQAVDEGKRFENLKSIVLGGEKVAPGLRQKLASLVMELSGNEPNIVATYGFTESKMAWGECPFPLDQPPSGYHMYPDLGLIEVIDPATGDVMGDGEPGELVFTPLDSRGSVVLRYRTGDYIDGGLTYEPCPHCGRAMPRLVGNISRKTEVKELQLDKVKGTLVDFNELEHVLDDAENIGAWQLELRKLNDDPHDLDEVILHVERIGSGDDDALVRDLSDRLAAHTELRPNQVLFHNRRVMRELQGVGKELKEKRVADNRAKEGQAPPPRYSTGHNRRSSDS